MKVGTIETLEPEKKRQAHSGFSNRGKSNSKKGKGGGGDDNNGGGGGGGDNPNRQNFSEIENYQPEKSRVLMWFLLIVVFMTFGGLIGAYVVVSTNGVLEWKPFNLPKQLWFSTLLILTSSFTYYKSQKFIFQNDQPQARKWLSATTALGAVFIASQLIAWLGLVREGVYVQSNPYAGFFYILTVVHAVHVLGGIIALGAVVLRAWNRNETENDLRRSRVMSEVVGWYWHFMGVLWLCLFMLLGFWK